MTRSGVTGAPLLLLLLLIFAIASTITDASADEPSMQIWPTQSTQSRPVGKPLLLTCRTTVSDAKLISNLEWKDPRNKTIPLLNPKEVRPAIYAEYITGQADLGLYIPNLSKAMAGIYYCTAVYSNTKLLSSNVKIETIDPITWKDAPESQYSIKGKDYVIRCEVEADPSPTIDWMRSGDQIFTNNQYVITPKGLLIKNVTELDDDIYTCRAAVILTGELAERNIRLEVHSIPVIEPLDKMKEVLEGETASLTCKATGKPLPEYKWIAKHTDLSNADRFTVDRHRGILTMKKVEDGDSGPYTCVAENKAGTQQVTVQVEVVVKPKIFELINVTSSIKQETKLTCKATGRPAPTITFKKIGSKIDFTVGAQPDNSRIILDQRIDQKKGETIANLTILNTNRTDDGLYECKASNKGDTAYKTGHITVQFPPTFEASINQPPEWSWERKPANLTCLAESIPNATIEWRLNGIPITPDSHIRIEGTGPISSLIITPLTDRDYTSYRCIAKNILGVEEHGIELKKAYPPDLVQQVQLQDITATSIKFSITPPPERAGLPLRAIVVQYKDDKEFDWNRSKNKTWSINSHYTIENLIPMVTYEFRFAALNDVGLGSWGAHQKQNMPRRSSPEPPKLLMGTANEGEILQSSFADHYELRWKIPSDNGEPIEGYKLEYCEVMKVNGEWKKMREECGEMEIKSYDNTAYEMNHLRPDTHYRIKVYALNRMGSSLPGEMYMKTARGLDTTVYRHEEPALSSAAIIGIVIAGVILMLIVVDILLCCCRRQGVIATLCYKKSKQHDEDEAKLGSLYGWRFPLPYCSNKEPTAPPSPAPLPPPVKLASTPTDEKEPLKDNNDRVLIDGSMMRNTSVEFDGRRVHAKTGEIIGKNSAV